MNEIQEPPNEIFFSQISLFEIVIKQKTGKLPSFTATVTDVFTQVLRDNMTFLSLQNNHLEAYDCVPLLSQHRDPFDRILIASSSVEEMPIITGDKNFSLYSNLIKIFW